MGWRGWVQGTLLNSGRSSDNESSQSGDKSGRGSGEPIVEGLISRLV